MQLYNERRSRRVHTPTNTHAADNVPALPDERKDSSMPTLCSWETSASTTRVLTGSQTRDTFSATLGPKLSHLTVQPLKLGLCGHGEIFVQKPLLTTLRRVSCVVKCTCTGRKDLRSRWALRQKHKPPQLVPLVVRSDRMRP